MQMCNNLWSSVSMLQLTEWSLHDGPAWHSVPAAFPARPASCISSHYSPYPPPSAWLGPSSPASCAPALLRTAFYMREKKHYWIQFCVGDDWFNALQNHFKGVFQRLIYHHHPLVIYFGTYSALLNQDLMLQLWDISTCGHFLKDFFLVVPMDLAQWSEQLQNRHSSQWKQ